MKKNKFTRGVYKVTSAIKSFFKYLFIRKNTFYNMGLYYISNIDGHDIKAMEKAFKYAKNAPSSVAIHISTIKGKGYDLAEKDKIGDWHGVAPFDVETGEPLNKIDENHICWSGVYANELDQAMANHEDIVVINPATTVGSKLVDIYDKYPERAFDVGIAEEHAAIFASGAAASNIHPYLSVYSTFLQRAYDEISHDIARINAPVTLLIDRVGLPGEDGETHEGIFDVAYLMSMPNVAICMAKDMSEAHDLFNFSISYAHPLAVRYPRGKTFKQELKEPNDVRLGMWKKENDVNSDTVIISYGPVINDLVERFKETQIINALFQKPIDEEMLKSLLGKKRIIIYDLYGTKEGFASLVIDRLSELEYKGKISTLCVPTAFISHGSISSQVKKLHLGLDDVESLIKG